MKRKIFFVLISFALIANFAFCQEKDVEFSKAYIAQNDG